MVLHKIGFLVGLLKKRILGFFQKSILWNSPQVNAMFPMISGDEIQSVCKVDSAANGGEVQNGQRKEREEKERE